MVNYFALVVQTLLAVALAPALTGLIRWLKARLQGRRGAPLWQPYFELRKLFAKEVVVSQTASWLFRFAPFVVFGTSVVVASLLPLVFVPMMFDRTGDLFAAVYLLLLGTFFLALAGLDTGSAFGGMGSSREMTVVALTEPTVALSIFALALTAGSTNLSAIAAQTLAEPARALGPAHVLGFAALFVVTLAETGRLPVDNPSTHLELTMIHEAMVLEYSGPYLALDRVGQQFEAVYLPRARGQPLCAMGHCTDAGSPSVACRAGDVAPEAARSGGRHCGPGDPSGQTAVVSCAGAAQRLVRVGVARRDVDILREVTR